MNLERITWITWENHRRTEVLSKELGASLSILSNKSKDRENRIIRYVLLSFKTFNLILKEKPSILIVQNPSIVLAFIACCSKIFFNYILVVDRHSNFKFHKNTGIVWRVFHFLSRFTVGHADITIVTNRYLADIIDNWGGNSYVLPDKIPELLQAEIVKIRDCINIIYVCSFSEDEPIEQVLSAVGDLDGIFLYITGNYSNSKGKKLREKYSYDNVEFTGFLSEKDFQSFLLSVDIVMVLTKQEYTLTCGAYEAVSFEKPMVLSNTKTINNYFYKGAIYCDPNADSIRSSIREATSSIDKLKIEVIELKKELQNQWEEEFILFKEKLSRAVVNNFNKSPKKS